MTRAFPNALWVAAVAALLGLLTHCGTEQIWLDPPDRGGNAGAFATGGGREPSGGVFSGFGGEAGGAAPNSGGRFSGNGGRFAAGGSNGFGGLLGFGGLTLNTGGKEGLGGQCAAICPFGAECTQCGSVGGNSALSNNCSFNAICLSECGFCVECKTSEDCHDSSLYCDARTHVCLPHCSGPDPQCKDPNLQCDVQFQVCVECLREGDCPSNRPKCVAGVCVECIGNMNCTHGTCINNHCQ